MKFFKFLRDQTSLNQSHLAYHKILPTLYEVSLLVLANNLALRKLLPDYRPLV